MTRRKTLSDHGIANLKPKETARYMAPDPECRGLYIRVMSSGLKSFVVIARSPHGKKQVWATIGGADHFTIEEARDKAREAIKRIRAGQPTFEALRPKSESFESVTRDYLKRHVAGNGYLSEREIKRIFEKYVLPAWRDREFVSIRKSDVAKLLDAVEGEKRRRWQADKVLITIQGLMRWQANRMDDYACPISGALRRTDPKARKRDRILSDDEIRLIWPLLDDRGTWGAMVKVALLTAQRLEKIATMRWNDVSDDGVWTVPHARRQKGVGGALALPELALQVIRAQPRIEGCDYVFAGRSEGHFRGASTAKKRLDDAISAKVVIAPWRFHDLRRTARSLMARIGVQTELAERILGHVQPSIVETYNRHDYLEEKRAALAKLARAIELILLPPESNVVNYASMRR